MLVGDDESPKRRRARRNHPKFDSTYLFGRYIKAMTQTFSINFDYRCPFARNANEHLVTALRNGAPYDVSFKGFSLTEAHVEEGGVSAFADPKRHAELIAVAAGITVRDRFPDQFLEAHLSLFAIRHDDGKDLRDESVVREALTRAGVDADAVFHEIEEGWPLVSLRTEHETSVVDHAAFGVPTFISGDQAVFVRIMTRPEGNGVLATQTIDQVLALLASHPEINEYKHTTIAQ